jgi:hypothetical protein
MARPKAIIPTVEEIQERNRLRAEKTPAKGTNQPISIPIPEPFTGEPLDTTPGMNQVTRISEPPPEIVTPNQTLSNVVAEKRLSVTDILKQHDINPVEELLAMYNERVEDPDSQDYGRFVMTRAERVSLMKEILRYQHPTLKAVEHKGDPESNRITVVLMMPDGSRSEQTTAQRGKVIDVP